MFLSQWEVASLVTEVFYQLLRGHHPQGKDFINQQVELQGGGITVANKPAGHHILVHLLNDGDMLRMVRISKIDTPSHQQLNVQFWWRNSVITLAKERMLTFCWLT